MCQARFHRERRTMAYTRHSNTKMVRPMTEVQQHEIFEPHLVGATVGCIAPPLHICQIAQVAVTIVVCAVGFTADPERTPQ
eukprot:8898601-Pyramimonas_sp.AAC.1